MISKKINPKIRNGKKYIKIIWHVHQPYIIVKRATAAVTTNADIVGTIAGAALSRSTFSKAVVGSYVAGVVLLTVPSQQ